MRLSELKTPALVLDRAKLRHNTAAMSQRMKAHGVVLRPHMKTAKSIDVARLALDGNAGGITVSTLREAAYFLEHGIRDITYAVGIVPAKLDEVAALERGGAELTILTDDVSNARAVAEQGERMGQRFRVLIEIDIGPPWTVYAAGGAGVAIVSLNDPEVVIPGEGTLVGEDEDDTVFAYQAGAGSGSGGMVALTSACSHKQT